MYIIILLAIISPACGEPGTLTNGRLRLSNSTTVIYTCDTGYRLSGASTRHCTANGVWTENVPECIRELRTTKTPQIDQNSLYSFIDRLVKEAYFISVSIINDHKHAKWHWHS